jgi:hypothetical protein
MQIELHLCDVGVEQRWQWLQHFEHRGSGRFLGAFLSYRDDSKLVWLQEHLANAPVPIGESVMRVLAPTIGSTITSLDDFQRMTDPVLELRQYRIAPGQRTRFATFLRNRTLAEQTRLGMNIYGPFDDLEDENNLIWFRGFPDLFERDRRKAAFYEGRLWLEELQDEAFSMIEDYSNVMLLAPAASVRA